MAVIQAQALTAGGFAPFGQALLVPGTPGRRINGGSSQRFDGLAPLDLLRAAGTPCLSLFRCEGVDPRRPCRLQALERHALGSQTFVPLGQASMLAVVAPGTQAPDQDAMQAFLVGPGQGITLGAGVWHHPLITLGPGDVMVLERQAAAVDCEVVQLGGEWRVQWPVLA